MWDPEQYARYADERSRPFFELTARIGATDPSYVVDLGCGDGELTATLAGRWPTATVLGVDSSAEMLARATPTDRLAFTEADIAGWRPDRPVDVLVSNAAFQWVPGHPELLSRWLGWVPDVPETRVLDPAGYVDRLAGAGCTVDAWETTYLHLLDGDDPVLEWKRGTALRPVLAALSTVDAAGFSAEYGARLREAYPRQPYGTVFPFRRIFVVAHR